MWAWPEWQEGQGHRALKDCEDVASHTQPPSQQHLLLLPPLLPPRSTSTGHQLHSSPKLLGAATKPLPGQRPVGPLQASSLAPRCSFSVSKFLATYTQMSNKHFKRNLSQMAMAPCPRLLELLPSSLTAPPPRQPRPCPTGPVGTRLKPTRSAPLVRASHLPPGQLKVHFCLPSPGCPWT